MLKYESTLVTFTEIPQEISLCFNITNCPCNCRECFEPWLAKDYGKPLDINNIGLEVKAHPHISCICFMGGDRDHSYLSSLCKEIHKIYPEIKLAMYSGFQQRDPTLEEQLNYYKCGPFIPEQGPLNSKTTNQIFWVKQPDGSWENQTYLFQKEKI